MKPLLAGKLDFNKLKYPVFVSPKLDGIRCIVSEGRPMSRTWKQLPNRYIRDCFAEAADIIEGFDGELVVGLPTAPNVYNASLSGIMSELGEPEFLYFVFDNVLVGDFPYKERLSKLRNLRDKGLVLPDGKKVTLPEWCRVLPQLAGRTQSEVEEKEEKLVGAGYEGIIVRSPWGRYKQGRSTTNEGILLKLKRYQDDEAIVIGFEELMHNENPAFTDAQGHTKHTSHQAGQRPGNMLGALVCQPLQPVPYDELGRKSPWQAGLVEPAGPTFNIGTGFDMAQRKLYWHQRDKLIGKIVKFRHLPHGALDAPRHPVFLGFRDPIDL